MTDLHTRIAALPPAQRAVLEARLADLAAARGQDPQDRILPRDRARPTPLSVAQQREWAVGRFRSVNNITGALRLEGRLDLALLGDVLTTIIERHEVLRTTVELSEAGTPVQMVQPTTPVPTPVVDLTHLPPSRHDGEISRRARTDAARPFDPGDPQRIRVTLLRLDEDVHVALFAADHAASDAWSLAIMVEELAAIFRSRIAGDGPALPPLDVQFGDVAAWQRERLDTDRLDAEVRHWCEELAGMPTEPALPVDRPHPARPTYAGDVYDMHLPARLTAEVQRFGEEEGASLFTVLLAACSVLLNRYLGEDDVVVGSLVSGRTRAETQQLIGSFANPLPLRVRLRDDQTLRDVVREARRTLSSALDHQDLPFDRVIEELGLGRESSRSSFSPVWINVITVPDMTLELPGLRITPVSVAPATTSVDLTLNVTPSGDALLTQWHYMTELFDAATVAVLAEQFQRVLHQLVTAPDTPVWAVELATGAASDEPGAAPAVAGFVEQFRRRVAIAPYSPAVICDGVATSYGELDRRANRLAHRLRAVGVGRDERVGVLVDRSPALAVAILGVLKAGGAYVPVDSTYPPERMAFILDDSDARVLVTEPQLAGHPGSAAGRTTVLVDGPADSGADDDDDLDLPDPASAAYVVYTSGSTGRPKGAVIEHRSLAVFARDVVDRLGLGTGDRFLQFASPSFDVLVEELFPTWLAGGAVVIPTKHLISGEDDLVSLVDRERLTVMELPTAYWHEWVRELDRLGTDLPDHLRLVIIGGERVLPERLAMWRRTGVPLVHVYGLTETTVSSTFFRLDPGDPRAEWPNFPIGTPLPSADLRILDQRLRPVPAGGTGELYIGGVSLARCYLGRPGLTAQRFVADPARPGERLYRTGDLVRSRADGNLEFLTRVDTQIKIRGFRVEPTEIESVLTEHPGVAEAVVTAYEPAPGDRRLVAYTVPALPLRPTVGELRAFLAERLPSYLVPSAFVELDALPLNANGKIDRDRLPAPDRAAAPVGEGFREPRSEAEQTLTEIVARVVGVPRIGVDDNFFEVGGDSILAIQVVAQAQEAGLRLTPYDLFANPSVAELAAVVAAGQTVDAEQADVTGPVPLAPTQHWFCAAGFAEPAHWNTSVLLDLAVDLEPDLLRDAVEHVVAHHDGLRQRLLLAGSRTRSRIAPRGDETPFSCYDISDGDLSRRLAEVGAELQRGLDPAVGPMLRVALLRAGQGRPDRLAVVAHRLVADTPSMRILLDDLETAVVQLAAGEELRFLPKTTSWQSWGRRLAAHAASESVQGQREYWSEVVAGEPGHGSRGSLPVDRAVDPGTETGATTRTVTETLDAAATTTFIAAADRLACTAQELLLAALAAALGEWTGASQHLVDLERHDRPPLFDDVDLTRTVGWFSRTHPLVLTADGAGTLARVKESLRAVPAGGVGWQLLRQGREPLPAAPVDLVFGYTGRAVEPASGAFAVEAETLGADRSPLGHRPYPIEVHAGVLHGELVTRWDHSATRHDTTTVERLAARYTAELRSLIGAGDAERTAADFPLARVDQQQLTGLLGRLTGK